MPDWLLNLLESGALGALILGVANVLVKIFLPNASTELLAAINLVLVAILTALGVTVNQAIKNYRATRK